MEELARGARFRVKCDRCGSSATVGPWLFEGVDWRPRADPAARYEVRVDDRPPTIEDLVRSGSGDRRPHPLRDSRLPLIEIACPRCEATLQLALGIFVVPRDVFGQEVTEDLVGQRGFRLINGGSGG